MSRPRLLVIDPSLSHPETQGVQQVLAGWEGEFRVLQPGLSPGDGPAAGDAHEADGVVVLGSRASVHDDEPGWLPGLAAWLRPVVDGSVALPLLGVCFGHQLLAHLAGGEVGFVRPDRGKIVGIEETRLQGGRLVPGERTLRVVVSHREEVKTAPAGFRVVARRASAPIDGLEHERLPLFGFQFHPEARGDFLAACGLDPAGADARVVADSQRVLGAFRRLVLERSRRGGRGGVSSP